MRPVHEIFISALAALDTAGWCQHAGQDSEGRICLGNALVKGRGIPVLHPVLFLNDLNEGSLQDWADTMAEWSMSHKMVLDVVRDLFPDRVTVNGIPGFNDDPHTTFEDVRLVLKVAIENCE
jgi:hypothetical protein